jgi:antibiotic biosynthesis monooxygenase (ABM) superfamily enzyme
MLYTVSLLLSASCVHAPGPGSVLQRSECLAELSARDIMGTVINAYGGSISGDTDPASDPSSSGRTVAAGDSDSSLAQASKRITLHNCLNRVPKALPPPKWKLAVLITGAVYSTLLVINVSGSVDVMLSADMPLGLVLFLSICHSVVMLVYAGLPLLMSIPFINKWLRSKRRCEPSQMHPLLAMLDQGLQVFSIKLQPREVPQSILDKISKLEVRVDKLLSMNTSLQAEVHSLHPPAEHSDAAGTDTDTEPGIDETQITHVVPMANFIESYHEARSKNNSSDLSAPLTMAVRHYVKWEHQINFENWTKDMDTEMRK